MSTVTPNLGLTLPTPNVDVGWGSTLNDNFTLIDDIFGAGTSGTTINVNVGGSNTFLLAGTMILGSGDGTATTSPPTIRGPARTGTNAAGSDITIDAANGTGTAGSGKFIFRTAPAGPAGTVADVMQNALVIGRGSDTYLIDVGAGGSAATGGVATLRLNGSSAGVGSAGGAALFIANDGVNTGAFGNRSTIFAGTTAFDDSTVIWGSDYIGFVIGSGTLAASNERVRFGSAGQIYLWDDTLGTPALYSGTAGQVMTSNGSSGAAEWKDPSINQVASQTFLAAGISFSNIPATVKTIILTVTNLDPTADVRVQLGTSAGYVSSGYASAGSAISGSGASTQSSTTGFLINLTGSVGSGSIRLTHMGSNIWACDHVIGCTTAKTCMGGGVVTLPGTLDRLQIIPDTGTFATSGLFNLMYL